MATPVRIGAHVALSEDKEPLAFVSYDVVDEEGNVSQVSAPPGVNLDVTSFVDLDDSARVTVEPGTVGLGKLSTLEELEEAMRETLFEDELREIALDDAEVAEMLGELEDLIEALAREGIEADEALLRSLPFVVEVDAAARATLGL